LRLRIILMQKKTLICCLYLCCIALFLLGSTGACPGKEILYSLSGDQVYQSTSGSSWDGLYIESDIALHYNDMAFDIPGRIMYLASGTGILKSSDSGVNWQKIYPSGKKESFNAFAVGYDDSSFICATTYLYLYISFDRGKTWSRRNLPQKEIYYMAAFSRERKIYIAGNKKIFTSSDLGKNWSVINANISTYAVINDMAVNPKNSSEIYLPTTVGLYKSTDGGKRWWLKSITPKEWIRTQKIVYCTCDPSIMYQLSLDTKQGGLSYLRKSRDGGNTWFTVATKEEIRVFGVHPLDSGRVYYLGYSTLEMSGTETLFKNIYATSNGGKSWKELDGILPGSEQITKIMVRPW